MITKQKNKIEETEKFVEKTEVEAKILEKKLVNKGVQLNHENNSQHNTMTCVSVFPEIDGKNSCISAHCIHFRCGTIEHIYLPAESLKVI